MVHMLVRRVEGRVRSEFKMLVIIYSTSHAMQSQVKFFGACKNISGASHQRGAAMFSQTTHVDGNNLNSIKIFKLATYLMSAYVKLFSHRYYRNFHTISCYFFPTL